MTDDTTWLDATAQFELIRSGEASAKELVEAAIERIEALNPTLNAVIHASFDEARDRPGVPFLLKDVLATEAGRPYHCGLRAARDAGFRATADSWLVERYRTAGFAVLGRTNTPELATTVTTEPLAYGPTRNPWDPERTPGGSSGGSAAAVASGMVAAAHGNDMGGSIRVPAANCGLVGLKPSRGRTSLAPDFGEFWGPITHQHVLTRTVRDCAAILDATAGPAPGDPYAAAPPARPWTAEVATEPGPLRIGYRTTLPDGTAPHPEVTAAVESVARLLDALGHRVREAALPALDDPVLGETVPVMFGSVVARDAARWSTLLGHDVSPDLEPMNATLAELGASITAVQWLAALEAVQSWSRRMAAAWSDHDLVLLPVTPEPPLPLGEMAPDAKDPFELLGDLTRMVSFTIPFNLTGEPAISLPLYRTEAGLPIGVQVVAPMGGEDLLFRLAGQLEQARPWSHHRPPTHLPGPR
ncbi:MAG TPA: amidase [Acidimicrobiales bacterium]|nr:amidase [Acidimicrobiales bacterium]